MHNDQISSFFQCIKKPPEGGLIKYSKNYIITMPFSPLSMRVIPRSPIPPSEGGAEWRANTSGCNPLNILNRPF